MHRGRISQYLGISLGICFVLLTLLVSCTEDKVDVNASGVLDGTIMDFLSEQNIYGAILTTNPPTISVASDSTGYFIFKSIDVGEYNLIARKNGFISSSVSISVKENDTTRVAILLERSSEYNDPPEFTGEFSPAQGEDMQNVDLRLSWTAADPNAEDSLIYDLKLYESGNEESVVFTGIEESFLDVTGLKYNTVYFWQITASDPYISVQSELLSFRTMPLPDNQFMFARKASEGDFEIYSSDTTENLLVRLTSNTMDDWQPRLSPKRDMVAFVSHENLESHIFTMDREGLDRKQVSEKPVTGYNNPGRGIAWSPFGDEIIYGHYDELLAINANGSGSERLIAKAPANRHFRDVDWSLDGNLIVALAVGIDPDDSEIYLMNANGTNSQILVNNLEGIMEAPTFSIGSDKVLFTRDVSGISAGSRQIDAEIFEINISSGQITPLSQGKAEGTNDLNPRYSPNGAYIIFENAPNTPGAEKSIWIMDNDGTDRIRVFSNAEMPEWR